MSRCVCVSLFSVDRANRLTIFSLVRVFVAGHRGKGYGSRKREQVLRGAREA